MESARGPRICNPSHQVLLMHRLTRGSYTLQKRVIAQFYTPCKIMVLLWLGTHVVALTALHAVEVDISAHSSWGGCTIMILLRLVTHVVAWTGRVRL